MNTLEHYGIKGMKWGVRRTPEQLGHTKSSRKSKTGRILGQSYDRDITFPKGSKSYRVQSRPDIPNGPLYVSYAKSDHIKYLNTAITRPEYGIALDSLSAEDRSAGKDPTLYSIELIAKAEIRAPSYQNAMSTFVEIVGDRKLSDVNPFDERSINGKAFIRNWERRGKNEQGASFSYTKFIDSLRKPGRESLYTDFKSRMEAKGYNALIDPEDFVAVSDTKRGNQEPNFKAPLIILDPQKTVEVGSRTKLTSSDIRYIGREYDMDFGDVNERDNKYGVSEGMRSVHEKWKKWYNDR